MKRKVASPGRRRRGIFVEYVREKRARGLSGCTEGANARRFPVLLFLRNLFLSDADGGANSVFLEETGNTRNGVEGNAHRGKSQTAAGLFPLYYKGGTASENFRRRQTKWQK